ncbi:hypothetical protein ABZ864_47720 [Streptomyces sp. NPDC047082]
MNQRPCKSRPSARPFVSARPGQWARPGEDLATRPFAVAARP